MVSLDDLRAAVGADRGSLVSAGECKNLDIGWQRKYLSQMKKFWLALFLLIVNPFLVQAGQIDFVIHPGAKWQLTDEARVKFNQFLEKERLRLLKKVPGLDFPNSFSSVDAGISQYMSADSKSFKNREVACVFLKKMRNNLSNQNQKELDELTKNGKVCIQADLPMNKQLNWTQTLARFIWNTKWIKSKGQHLSLESYLVSTSGDSKNVTPRIVVMQKGSFDGWGIAQSQEDRLFFASLKPIKKAISLADSFDPNNPKTFEIFGPEFKKFVEKDPFNAANLLMGQPTIYLSNGWPPNAMVELLAHEYGHIFRHLRSTHYLGDEKKIVWLNDEVHEEAAAEGFAWMSLHSLYASYPEIEVFHISKLIFMNKFSPNNFHYLGAAGLQESFHQWGDNDFNELKEFDSAPDLGAYQTKKKISSLLKKGPMPESVVKAEF
jgi:hypothetical protein